MILFLKDWSRYPKAEPHYETGNESFLKIAALYRDMGIENHMFPLSLLNPELRNVDPRDPILLKPQYEILRMKIAAECKMNFWYYVREIHQIPAQAGAPAVSFEAHRGNIATMWCVFNHITTFLISIRQVGKSITTDTLLTYLLNVRCQNTEIAMITNGDKVRNTNIKRLREMDECLPPYIRQRNDDDPNNPDSIYVSSLNNTLKIRLPQSAVRAADALGRGLTVPVCVIDEAPFLPNIKVTVPAMLAATGSIREKAKEYNEPYFNLFTTTSAPINTVSGKYTYDLVQNSALFTENIFDCEDEKELETVVKVNGNGKFNINITFNHLQLGKTDEWLREKIDNTQGSDRERISSDYFNEWPTGGQDNPLSEDLLDIIKGSKKDPEYREISKIGGYITNWFIPKDDIETVMENGMHVLSLDPSEGIGSDDLGMRVINVKTGETVATGNYNETNTVTFTKWLATNWFLRWPYKVIGIIERRSIGVSIISSLILTLVEAGVDPFKVLFNRVVHDSGEHRERFEEINVAMSRRPSWVYEKYIKHFGFATSGSGETARSSLYSNTLQNAAKIAGDRVYDNKTIEQIMGLEIRNNRVDHGEGKHDDMVIAWLLGYWLLLNGRNLSFYGIDTTNVLNVSKTMSFEDEAQAYDYYANLKIKEEIQTQIRKLETERDENIVDMIDSRLKYLTSQLEDDDTEVVAIQSYIDNIKEKRKASKKRYYTSANVDHIGDMDRKIRSLSATSVYRPPTFF